MVGIGGGALTPDQDICLSDGVVSVPNGRFGGVDLGKRIEGRFERTMWSSNAPPTALLSALPEMRQRHGNPDQ